jgi:DNA polymerase-1
VVKILIVRTETELAEMLSQLEKADTYCLDTETLDRGLFDLGLVGLSLSFDGKRGFYVPTGHAEESAQLPAELVLERMKPILERPGKMCLMHNAKYDLEVLKVLGGIEFPQDAGLFCSKEKRSPIYDTMVAAWLLDTENEIGLKALSKRYLKHTMVELSEIAKKEKHPVTGDDVYRPDLVPIDELAKYAIDDAVRPFQLKQIFDQGLEKWGLEKVFYELEMPYVFVLTDMELAGVLINREKLEEFYGEAPDKLKALEQRIFACRPGGEEFNIGSQPQLNQVLFKELGIKPLGEKGKSGHYSTKEEYMEVWANKHEICKLILDYRKLDKLIGTYLIGLSKRIDPDGRIRSNFNRFISTGRLSSSRPNLQNIPRPENDLFGLRSLFIAPEGKTLIVVDYSQIELRILAHFSRDPKLMEAYMKGEDIHAATAKALFDLPEPVSEVKEKHGELRSIAKNYNFAMVYEAGVKKLAAMTGTTESRAKQLREKYFDRFPGIERYQQWMHHRAERDGYVKTLVGRYRHLSAAQLPGKTKKENALKHGAFRQSSNTPIQGSAADVISIAMRNINRRLKDEGYSRDEAQIVLQVHDELILEVVEEAAPEVAKLVASEMENAVKLRVPIVADVGIAPIWSEAK